MTETDIKATNSSSSADLSDSTDKEKTATPVQPVKSAPVVSTPVSQPTQPTQSTMGGGEKTVAKDPKGMFDYSNCETYKVTRGDKLIDVAFKYHVALQQLRYFNHLDKATMEIKPDQVLYIPDKPVNVPVGK
ncbi:LysM peptidoglycan-binding domain-containing protein [Lactobacillus helveticus]|uniref:LysM peptidoglycan-binding domain-containing protein n=1 Tax=Lactobacillus helveticus TaxID=1587 RepID=UPI0019D8D983|nr:LysM domain-containing protein [Lactobacillus helveticus]NRO92516.1 hypothetical protein [Lactobacillus helveticus]